MVRLITAFFALFLLTINAQQIDLSKQVKGALAISRIAPGTANQLLGTNAGATAQEHKTLSVGTSGSDFAVAHATNSLTLNLPDAGASARGAVTTGTQTLAGAKTFSSSVTTDVDFLSNDHSDADTYLSGIYPGTPQIGSTVGNIFATSQADAPDVGFMSWVRAESATGDHVGIDAVCITNANNGKCWGANFIVSNNTVSITNSKLIGLEVDVQPVTEIPSSESAGIIVNGFNLAIPGAGLHIGGSSGGTWANGIIMDGIDGAGLLPNGATTMDSLVNSASGTFNDDAIVLSNTHRIRFRAASGADSAILAKSDNNLYFIPPQAGLFVWRDTADSTNRMVLNGATGDLSPGRSVLNGSVAHAGLAAAAVAVGQQIYCSDCTEASDPCTSGGNGTMAFRVNGGAAKWKCL